MPELVTAAQLRAVLGVPNTLYDDTALDAIIDTAEDAIGDFLIQWKVGIDKHYSETATETTIHTTRPTNFMKHKQLLSQVLKHTLTATKQYLQ
jgi:hypothetical protein